MKKTITCPGCGRSFRVSAEQMPLACCSYGWRSLDEAPVVMVDWVPPEPPPPLTNQERVELFGESDPSLIGNQIADLTTALGIPPCGGCKMRREWLNKAHAWLREKLGSST